MPKTIEEVKERAAALRKDVRGFEKTMNDVGDVMFDLEKALERANNGRPYYVITMLGFEGNEYSLQFGKYGSINWSRNLDLDDVLKFHNPESATTMLEYFKRVFPDDFDDDSLFIEECGGKKEDRYA